MTIKIIEPGDVNIIKMKLGKTDVSSGLQNASFATLDFRSQLISLSIYEDIEEPSMLCEITFVDSVGMLTGYPITGEELAIISFNTPGREKPFHHGFWIYSIEGQGQHPSGKGTVYTLKGVTSVHYFSAGSYIQKSYNTTVDEIVTDIIKTSTVISKLSRTQLNIEKTKGLVPITIPSLHVFAAVDFVRQKAISAVYPSGGTFVFFENQFGLNFKSVEGLITEGKKTIASKIFTFAPDTSSDKTRDQYAFRNILRYTHLGKFDSVKKVVSGSINNTVQAYDVLKKSIETTEFKLGEKAGTFTATDNKGKLPNSNEFIKEFNRSSKSFFMPKDTSRGNDFVDASYGSKNAFSSMLNENSVRLLIHGDSYLTVGDMVELRLPDPSGTTEKKLTERLNSGNYMIAKLRHIITMEEGGKPKHQIAMDCVKMGYK